MSTTEDINSNKDEDDLFNENIDDASAGNSADGNNASITKSPEKADNLGVLSESACKNISEANKNVAMDNPEDILNKNTANTEPVKSSSLVTDEGKGDAPPVSEEIIGKPVSAANVAEDPTTEKDEIEAETPDIAECSADKKNKRTRSLSYDEIDEEDLQLRWDDDDGNDLSTDNIIDNNTKDDVATENTDASKSDAKSPAPELDSVENMAKIEMPLEDNLQSTDSELISDKKTEEKDAETILEEKLLEDDVEHSTDIPKTVTDTPMDINEDELLRDDSIEETAMEPDSIDKEMAEIHRDTDKSLEPDDNTSKVQEPSAEIEIVTELQAEAGIPEQAEKQIEEKISNTDQQEENVDNANSDADNIPIADQATAQDDNNHNNNDDSQDENQMDVDNSNNTSTENSPIHIKTDHGLHKPDVMLEIPTQELIDIDDVLDSPDVSKIDDDVNSDSKYHDKHDIDSKIDDDNEVCDSKIDEEETEGEGMENKNEEIVDSLIEGASVDDVNKEQESSEVLEESVCAKEQPLTIEEPQPSTSTCNVQMTPDTSDEVPDVSDSLGLLAESRRVVDDDEDQDEDEDGDADDDEDSDIDESSNQMTAEHSEDSNAQHSETDQTKEEQEKETEDNEEDREENINQCEEDFEYTLNDVGNEEQLEDNNKMKTEEGEEITIEETNIGEMKGDEMQMAEELKMVAPEAEGEGITGDELKEGDIKKEEIKVEVSQKEGEGGELEKEKPLLPEIKTAPESSEVKIKEEKPESTIKRRPRESVAVTAPTKRDVVLEETSQCSITSNDDVIEQIDEIETVKLSDDDDEPPQQTEQTAVDQTATPEDLPVDQTPTSEDMPADQTATPEDLPVEQKTLEKIVEQPQSEKIVEQAESEKIVEEPPPAKESAKPSAKSSPAKLKELTISSVTNESVLNIVELEESSSEDDTQIIQKDSRLKKLLETPQPPPKLPAVLENADVTSVNLPPGIEIMSTSAGNTSEIVVKEGEVVISGVPKPPPHKPARLNTSEVTIKTASPVEQTLVIPEAKINDQPAVEAKSKPKLSLEIFSLDSDEEDTTPKAPTPPPEDEPKQKKKKCINYMCRSGATEFLPADVSTAAYYDASRKRRPMVCEQCALAVRDRQQRLVEGIRNMTPLLQLDMSSVSQELVEILDSDSEDEEPRHDHHARDTIGDEAADFLEKNLSELLNKTWKTHSLDDRLKETQDELNAELMKLESASKEINQMLSECQRVTDRLRNELYATFQHRIQELPPILIYETPDYNYIGPEVDSMAPVTVAEVQSPARATYNSKRKLSGLAELPAKRPAIPLGYAPLDGKNKPQDTKTVDNKALDDDKDISVVKLSAESAPADLPPPGELSRPPLRLGMAVFAMKNAFGPWLRGKITEIMPKTTNTMYTTCRVKFDHKTKSNGKLLTGRCIAYTEPPDVRLTIGTRLVALFKDQANKKESYYSGIVAEVPNPVNNYRYLVFFDDGYAQYVSHPHTRIVCECSPLVWEEVHPFSREFVREYLMAYPERPMVRLHEGQYLKTEWNGKWWSSRVLKVDASLAQVLFTGDGRREWVYRGSTRLAPLYLELRAAERHRPRPMPRSKHARSDMPYVEYTRSDEQQPAAATAKQEPTPTAAAAGTTPLTQQQNEEIRRQRAVAKKSTASASAAHAPATPAASNLDTVTSRVVYYTPKSAVRPYKLTPHKCSPKCKRSDVLSLKELRTYNPLAKPLLSGWERQIVRFKGQREVMYRAPCGRRLRNMKELHRYLRATDSELPVDLFDFYHATHCLAEFVLNKCLVGKKDLSHGKENVPVPCVNYYDDSLPEFCSYNTERTPTSGVPLNLDPEFLCGCDCTDDCEDKTKCACWKMTLEGARTIGLEGQNVGYEYKRLPEPLPSGIYECNSRCKCKETCLNRVAQHPLQLKLQVFKTLNRGWGIRALNDVPKGSFLCVYAGNLLTDATANLDGLNEGDEYLAELDYIEVVEQMKEGYEEDIPEADKKMIKKESGKQEESPEEASSSSEEDESASKTDKEDDDFRPGHIGLGVMEFNKRLRKRGKKKQEEKDGQSKDKDKDSKENKEGNPEEDCITISDDEEVREPSRFAAQPGMGGSDFVSKYKSVRALFGEDEACYIMDAKVQGNIGRYLNHSCSPNVFVQNVFVDTHDPRFPWVAFFALSHIRAGTELTWNYNYDVGSVPGKVLYCYCEAPNCRGRLL